MHTCLKRGFTRRNYSLHDHTNLPLRKLQKTPLKIKIKHSKYGMDDIVSLAFGPAPIMSTTTTQVLNFLASRDVDHSTYIRLHAR